MDIGYHTKTALDSETSPVLFCPSNRHKQKKTQQSPTVQTSPEGNTPQHRKIIGHWHVVPQGHSIQQIYMGPTTKCVGST